MQRHTKIIATLGPAVASAAGIQALVEAGIDVARLNFSHGDRELHRTMAGWVRDASRETGRTVALMQDIQGPKLRVGEFANGRVTLEPGRHVTLVANGALGSESVIPVGYEPLLDDVEPGDRIQLADGLIRCEVVDRTEAGLVATVRVGGVLSDHKGVAFPDSKLSLEILTPKDESDLAFGRDRLRRSVVRAERRRHPKRGSVGRRCAHHRQGRAGSGLRESGRHHRTILGDHGGPG
jgi:pyruvate kinase